MGGGAPSSALDVLLEAPVAALEQRVASDPASPGASHPEGVSMLASLVPLVEETPRADGTTLARLSPEIMWGAQYDDEEIPIAHAKMLYAAACRPAPPFWVKGAGHNDVVEHSEEEYFRRVGAFLAALEEEAEVDLRAR